LILSKELKYIDEGSFIELNKDIFEIKKMIEGLIKKIN
jgi:four helix bundle protein